MAFEAISQTIFSSFMIGVMMGILESINKKLVTILWLSAVVLVMIGFLLGGVTGTDISPNWGVWNWVVMLIFVNIGGLIGRHGFDQVKKELLSKLKW